MVVCPRQQQNQRSKLSTALEVISNRGISNAIGWKQGLTIIEEDNQACVYASEAKHMTRNLRHLDLAQLWFKEKVADGTCIIKGESKLKGEQL